ncbi:MAG: hypothetical protein HYY43_00940 [Deltaproteobacteria bacterium]|nr:hypothetical protein [Deltaproteobacteria bacterium]MBI2974146.1 hypothetical protein [Deltaproteobacteria bacterium]
MKKIIIAICAVSALTIAGRVLADDPHAGHQHGATAPAAADAGHDHGAMMYHCPMHKDEASAKPGKCPKCGMDMAKMDSYGVKYRCPMHKDLVSGKPGKCEKCGMALEAVESREPRNRK